jgi:hypothetical protein
MLLYTDDLKLRGRSEGNLENGIKIVKAINRNINRNFRLAKCAKLCLNNSRVQSKTNIGSTFEKVIEELGPRKTYKYLAVEKSHDIVRKNEKVKLKKENLRRLRLLLGTELSAKNKIQANG